MFRNARYLSWRCSIGPYRLIRRSVVLQECEWRRRGVLSDSRPTAMVSIAGFASWAAREFSLIPSSLLHDDGVSSWSVL